jgi:hypothetical protein
MNPQLKNYNANANNDQMRKTVIADYGNFVSKCKKISGMDQIIMRGIKKGSLIANFDAQIPTGKGNWDTLNAIQANIANNNDTSINVISSSLVNKNFDAVLGNGDVNLGLILGISIPLLILIILILILVKIRISSKNTPTTDDEEVYETGDNFMKDAYGEEV